MDNEKILQDAYACQICAPLLPHQPRPVFVVHPTAKINIVGQAPGRKVHQSGVPWDDASGKRLREWLGMSTVDFYDAEKVAIMPIGFCYPGSKKSGDLPPRPECAPTWHQPLLNMMPNLRLTLLIGAYAQKYYLGKEKKKTLTETVKNWRTYLPKYLPLPHPSPRNQHWWMKNEWFEEEVLPFLQEEVYKALRE